MLIRLAIASAAILALMTPSFAQQQDQSGRMQWHRHHDDAMRSGRLLRAFASGTFFHLKHGDDAIMVHCAQNENLQDCVNAAVDLAKAFPAMGAETNEEDENTEQQQNSNQ